MIKNFDVKSVEARKFVDVGSLPNMKISNKSMVTNMTKTDDTLTVEFVFTIEYSPNVANIKIEGKLVYEDDDAEVIFSSWKNKKNEEKMQKIQVPIVRRCLVKSVILANEINIAPPIPLPSVKKNKKEKKDYGHMFG
ncbi:MAG: hypothetical protein U9N35_00465 [Euryarchaeota archaeon]|nr:hypothetical protein [Euryarchaeota archaeon]